MIIQPSDVMKPEPVMLGPNIMLELTVVLRPDDATANDEPAMPEPVIAWMVGPDGDAGAGDAGRGMREPAIVGPGGDAG